MALDVEEISIIYNALIGVVETKYTSMWNDNQISAETYAQLMSETAAKMATVAADTFLKNKQLDKELELKERETEMAQEKLYDTLMVSEKQRETIEAQKALYEKQTESFDDNKWQKLLEAQLNYSSIIFQDATYPQVLNIAKEDMVNDVFNKITGKDQTVRTVDELFSSTDAGNVDYGDDTYISPNPSDDVDPNA